MIWRLMLVAIIGTVMIGCSGGGDADSGTVNKDVSKGNKPTGMRGGEGGGGKPAQMDTNP
jgi:hypothetical protein